MNETELTLAKEVAILGGRIDNHGNQIADIKCDIKDMKENQKAVYEIATSIKLLVQEISGIKSDVKDIKQGQTDLKQGQTDLNQKIDVKIADVNKEVDEKITEVTDKVELIEKKGTWDWMDFIKKTLIPALIVLGAGLYVNNLIN